MKKFHNNYFYLVIKQSFLHRYISSQPEINKVEHNEEQKLSENCTSVAVGTVTLLPHV